MLHTDTLKFLSQLRKNNTKEWFDKNRDRYENIREELVAFTNGLIGEIAKFDKGVTGLQPKDCIFRVNRDIRFSKDKSPYKSHLAAGFTDGGKKSPKAGYYFHVSPDDCFVGGGVWHPEPDILKKVRQEIDYNASVFKKIIGKPSFKKMFGGLDDDDKLSSVPKGYDVKNPNIELLKYKSYVCGTVLKADDLLKKDALKKVSAAFKELSPFIIFLNQAID